MNEDHGYHELLLSRLIDDDLSDDERASLRTHLESCPQCRDLYRAFRDLSSMLQEDLVEPPEELCAGVMDRIQADAGAPEKEPAKIHHLQKARRRWAGYVVAAACLVVVIGAGGLFVSSRNTYSVDMGSESAEIVESRERSIVSEDSAEEEVGLPEANAEVETEAEGAETYDAGGYGIAEVSLWPEEDEMDEEPMLGISGGEPALGSGYTNSGTDIATLYTWEDPAVVSPAKEADLEALLQDAGWPEGEPDLDWEIICAIEHNGVIYEFLTDPDEQYLLWQDAAEGLPVHSPGSVADLWALLED